jgi:hypothetical protein
METSSASGLELENYRATAFHLTHEEVEAWLGQLEAGENAPLP